METTEVSLANPNGTYSLSVASGASTVEVERFNTVEDAISHLNGLLTEEPAVYTVYDLSNRSVAYRVDWKGREAPPEDEPQAPAKKAAADKK